MSRNMKKMVAGMFLVSSIINNSMSVRERARMLNEKALQEQQLADQRQIKKAGKLEKELGYVSKGGAITVDFARKQALNQIRDAVADIEKRENLNTARDVVSLIVRNKEKGLRGERELEPMAATRPHVVYLLEKLQGLPEDEQIEILNILQNELARRAAMGIEDVEDVR